MAGLADILDGSLPATGVTSDSRKVKPGMVFVAIRGNAADGTKFIPAAIEKGACAVVAESGTVTPDPAVPLIESGEPRLALSKLAGHFFPDQPETIAAVTGTSGKTSVVTFLRQIWDQAGLEAASLGTTGIASRKRTIYGSLTTPDPVGLHESLSELHADGVRALAMEASSHGLDQFRLESVRLNAAAFTNLGRDHLDYHPTVEDYFQAKARLFTKVLPPDGTAVVFEGDEFARRLTVMAREAGRKVFRIAPDGDLALGPVRVDGFSQSVAFSGSFGSQTVRIPLAGTFQVYNAAVAFALAIHTGVEPDVAFAALEKLEGAKGRLEYIGSKNGGMAFVDYAHKPDALENALKALRPFASGRLIVAFGAGGDRDRGKRPVMGEIAERFSDLVIVTDDNPRSEPPADIRAEILRSAKNAKDIGDRREAIYTGVSELREGDVFVVAGKGHEEGQIIGDTVHPFSDHDVLRQALGL